MIRVNARLVGRGVFYVKDPEKIKKYKRLEARGSKINVEEV